MAQEAIEFFVIVSQFGVPQAVFGVRRMLPLIWSKEPGVREAVLDAYRRLYLNQNGGSERFGMTHFSPSQQKRLDTNFIQMVLDLFIYLFI